MSGQVKKIKSSLKFLDYYVKRAEFIYNEKFEEKPVDLDFQIDKEIVYLENEQNTILVTLNANIFEDAEANGYPFNMKLSITGIFEVDEVDEDKKNHFAEINATAILFPYLRSMVTTYSANANVYPLILPPINVVKLFKDADE